MKRLVLILNFIIFSSQITLSQKIEDIGAGVIDFLLRNPKTANKLNATETVALEIIGDLLKNESERKHQIEYATAGSNQISINSNDGRQAQFVKNENGKVFLLLDGVIYPIAQELINEAVNPSATIDVTTVSNTNTNFDYDSELKNYFSSDLYKTVQYKELYIVSEKGEYLSEIVTKTGVSVDYIGDKNYNILPAIYRRNELKLPAGERLTIAKSYPEDVIFPIFGFKWVRDLNGNNSYDFEEFNQKKRFFYDNENFHIAIPFAAGKYSEGKLNVQLYNNYTGDMLKSDFKFIEKNEFEYFYFQIDANELKVGTYKVNAILKNTTTQEMTSSNATFEIIRGNSDTKEITINEKKIIEEENANRNRITTSTPKGIFFYNFYGDFNNDNKYDHNEFTGLNKTSYSMKTEELHVGINFPNKSGEIIIQSWTKEGKLLGTTTNYYQRISGHWAGIGGDPYNSMDFIDMIQLSGPGEYKITVSFVEGGAFEQILLISD